MSYIFSSGIPPRWEVRFCPPEGEKYSPADAIAAISRPRERALALRRIRTIAELETWQWPPGWTKKIGDMYQLNLDNYRAYFRLKGSIMVVGYICRKRGNKAKKSDLDLARKNLDHCTRDTV